LDVLEEIFDNKIAFLRLVEKEAERLFHNLHNLLEIVFVEVVPSLHVDLNQCIYQHMLVKTAQ
jgi:hypothetical protein